jgi:hypothetical protein
MASRLMVVAADHVTLSSESDAIQASRGVQLRRGSTVVQIDLSKGWSLIETPDQPIANSSQDITLGLSTGRYNLSDRGLGRRADAFASKPQAWVPSVALMPVGHSRGTSDLLTLYVSRRLYELTLNDNYITYNKGSKDPASGQIDCAGWIEYANNLVYNELDDGTRQTLSKDFTTLFNNGAAYQIDAWNKGVSGILTGASLDLYSLLPGTLIGIHHQADSNGRPYNIDHIVQVIQDPVTLAPMITQSSAHFDGVNLQSLPQWIILMGSDNIGTDKMWAVDPYVTARSKIDAVMGTLLGDIPK